MNEFRARIGRVRMKNGGADVVVLDTPERPDIAADMIEYASIYGSDSDHNSELTGYVLCTFYSDNARAVAYHVPSNIPGDLMPAYVAELVRRKICTQSEACDVVNRSNGFDID